MEAKDAVITGTEEFCLACYGKHELDTDETWVDYGGYRFHKPFRCMCCGKEICARQFAYGRSCGSCDIGACQTGNRSFDLKAVHECPSWVVFYNREATIKRFAEALRVGV